MGGYFVSLRLIRARGCVGLASTLYAAVATLAAGSLGCGRWLAATQARHSRFSGIDSLAALARHSRLSDDGGSRNFPLHKSLASA